MNLLSKVLPPSDNDRGFLGIDGKGKRMQLDVHALSIPDVKLITTPRISDARGYFCETFQRADFAAQGLDSDFLQDNQSCSSRPGTVRGLHFQRPPFAQAKLVRVLRGRIFDVAVDLRRSSPNFGKHIAIQNGMVSSPSTAMTGRYVSTRSQRTRVQIGRLRACIFLTTTSCAMPLRSSRRRGGS